MIRGNAYGDRPSAELYVGWMQENTLMPAVQISIVSWDFDSNVTNMEHYMYLLQLVSDFRYFTVDIL
jgi:hypothetical protein